MFYTKNQFLLDIGGIILSRYLVPICRSTYRIGYCFKKCYLKIILNRYSIISNKIVLILT